MQNAIIVYNAVDFFKNWRTLPPETWLVWIDKSNVECSGIAAAMATQWGQIVLRNETKEEKL